MPDVSERTYNLETLEAMEALLNLCAEREKTIALLKQKLEEMQAKLEALAEPSAQTNPGQRQELLDAIVGILALCQERESEIDYVVNILKRVQSSKLKSESGKDAIKVESEVEIHQDSIMIVDDCQMMRHRTSELLKNKGYKIVATAQNGQEAVDLFKQLHPGIIIMDLDMPVMDGCDAMAIIKKQNPKVKVIVITGMQDQATIMRALSAGADQVLVKPVAIDRLLMHIRQFVGNSE